MMARTLVGQGSLIARRTVWVTGVTMTLLALVLSIYSVLLFEQWLAPEVDAKSRAVARSLQLVIDRAVGYGIPFTELQGMDPFLREAIEENSELAVIEVVDATGAVLFAQGQPGTAASTREVRQSLVAAQGEVILRVKTDYARNKLLEVLIDTAIVLFVAILLAFELLPAIVRRGLGGQMDSLAAVLVAATGRDFSMRVGERASGTLGRLIELCNSKLAALGDARPVHLHRATAPADIRVAMFVFVLAEQLCMPFFPLYVRDLYVPIPGLTEQAAIGLPITLFMLFVALGTMFGGSFINRVGSVRVFRWGVVLAAGGFLGLALAGTIHDVLWWRSLTAVGYALSTLACQAYVAETTTDENRTRAMSIFVGAVMVAAVCGSAIGGVLADLVGYRQVFVGALLLTLLSLLTFPVVPPGADGVQARGQSLPILRTYRLLAADRGFAAVMLLAAIPAKLLLTGVVFYLTPLYLGHLGFDMATIGRCIMLYYLPMAFAGGLAAWLADRYRLRLSMVVGGGAIAGLGCVASLYLQGFPAVLVVMAGLGIGQSLATASTYALVLVAGQTATAQVGQASALAAIRVLERVGSVIGPLLTGVLIAVVGYEMALTTLGGIMLVCVALLPVALRFASRQGQP